MPFPLSSLAPDRPSEEPDSTAYTSHRAANAL